MEAERRFDGREYPAGMCPFPFRLTGQGFFPGGDGLWRQDSELAQPSTGVLPQGGIIFLGNDFGTLQSYLKLRAKGYENPLTWKHLKQRVRDAGLPQGLTFFTNAVLGLRKEGKALDKKDWATMPGFADFCRRFLIYQIELLRPKLVVVLGPQSRATFDVLAQDRKSDGQFPRAKIGNHTTSVHYSTHPYGDFNFTADRKTHEAARLREVWTLLNSKLARIAGL
jgi:hypothetical protein